MDANQFDQQPKDQNVLSFMIQLVQEKHGDDVDANFLNQEANRLYDIFGNNLVSYFEPMLSEESKKQFNEMVKTNADQDQLLGFLNESIPNLEQQILQVLISFRVQYIQTGFQQQQPGQMQGQQQTQPIPPQQG